LWVESVVQLNHTPSLLLHKLSGSFSVKYEISEMTSFEDVKKQLALCFYMIFRYKCD